MSKNFLDFIAVLIQLTGTVVMFLGSPNNKPFGAFVGKSDPDYETPRRKNTIMKIGLAVLGLGFIVQIISLCIKMYSSS